VAGYVVTVTHMGQEKIEMIIEITSLLDKLEIFYDRAEKMVAQYGGEKLTVEQWGDFDGMQEQAIFIRMLRRPKDYLGIIKMAYEAGKNGDILEIKEFKLDHLNDYLE